MARMRTTDDADEAASNYIDQRARALLLSLTRPGIVSGDRKAGPLLRVVDSGKWPDDIDREEIALRFIRDTIRNAFQAGRDIGISDSECET